MFRFLVNRGLADYRVLLLLFRACLTGDEFDPLATLLSVIAG